MKKYPAVIAAIALLIFSGIGTHAASIANESRPRLESRDGNSVDTATGAFIQDLNLITLQGSRDLEFNLSYNSALVNKRGYVGYGWSHQYEGRIEGNEASVVTVYLNGNIGNQFRFAGAGQPYTPLNEQNRYDVLERVTIGGVNGVWRLRRLSGRTYLFDPSSTVDPLTTRTVFRLLYIQNVNSHTISIGYTDQGISQISAANLSIFPVYRPIATPLLHYLVHGSDRTFLQYDAQERLTRIYDPVTLETIAQVSTAVAIPVGPTGVSYPVSVSQVEKDRLIRVRASITHPRRETLQAFLTSPSGGRTVPLNVNGADYFLDAFLGEITAGTWILRVVDNVNDGISGTINSFRIERSEQTANWTQYDYDIFPFNRITRATDSKGQRLYSNTYDSQGRVAFQDDGRDDNGGWRFVYEDQPGGDLLTTVYDRTPLAHFTRFLHDSNFHLKSVEDALGRKTQYSYHPTTGDRTSITDARGNTTRFTYDAKGHLTSTVAPNLAPMTFLHDSRGNLTNVTDALNFTSSFKYDEFNNLTECLNALTNLQLQAYSGGTNGVLVGSVNKTGNGVVYGHDNNGRVISANVLNETNQAKMEYDGAGRLTKLTDTEGAVSTFVYDTRGNIIEARDPLGHKISYQFDHRNLRVSETDPQGNVTRYEYDGNGNVTRIINPLNQVTQFQHDGEDRLIRVTDSAGHSTQKLYDSVGRVVKDIDQLGNAISYLYDEVGNQTTIFGPTGVKTSEMTYNNLNAPVSLANPYGQTTVFAYDVLGQKTAQTDPRGKKTEFRFDPLGHVDRVTDPLGRQYRRFFQAGDVVDKVVDAGNKETKYTYTKKHQVETITSPRGAVTRLEYTANGLISRYTPPSLNKAEQYAYNPAGRLERTKHLDPATPDTVYAYDANGNITNISTQASGGGPLVRQTSRTYDALNRQISITDAAGNTVRHVYDLAGRVAQVIYPDAKTVQYTYDAAGHIRTITDWAGRVTEYAWNSFNKITSVHFPNQTTRVLKYDAAGRLLSRADFDAQGATIVSYQYSYDPNGFITCERLHTNPVAYEPPTNTFAFDDDNRLIQKDGISITHDADGNMTQGPVSGQSSILQWDILNHLRNAGPTSFNYDVEGRLTGWQNGAESARFTTVEAASGSQILVNESSSGGTTRYVYGVGLAYEETNGQIKVHHYDERGNTAALSNPAGQVSGTIAYGPFGEVISQTGLTETLFKHAGLFGVVTAPNGLNSMRSRWYSPELKRFISQDSRLGEIGLPGSLNRYSFAGNNPINFNDPNGEFWSIIGGAVIGAVIGAGAELISAAIKGETVDWKRVGAAAIGGAVAGALTGAGLGAVAAAGYGAAGAVVAGVAVGAAAGAVGGITENLVDAGLHGEKVDGAKLGLDAALGFAAGGLGGGLGAGAGAAIQKQAARGLARQGAIRNLVRAGTVNLSRPGVRVATGTSSAAIDLIVEVGKSQGGQELEKVTLPEPAKLNQAATATLDPAATSNVGKGGEYLHHQAYLDSLKAADRPQPDTTTGLSPF